MGHSSPPGPTFDDVFITAELNNRAARPTDYIREKLAIQELAVSMADQPEELLPRFVGLAMEIAGGVSAGLSLLETDPAPGVFRWRYLRGTLAPFEEATTPRNFSPCGVTLDNNAPVLALHAERYYTWISDANIVVPEVLLVPLHIQRKIPLGTLWIVSDKVGHFDNGHVQSLAELARFVGIALRMVRNDQALLNALEEQETLSKEMSHRVKNLFAITDGLIRMSAKSAATPAEMAKVLSGRVHALASAHTLVSRKFREVGQTLRASDLGAVIQAVVLPYDGSSEGAASRFRLEGPSISCGDHSINGVALVFHELATNAAKYGALANDAGGIDVLWRQQGDRLTVRWTEHGGPTMEDLPAEDGFGSSLIRRTILGQFGGTLDYAWRPEGLTVSMSLPIDRLSS